MGHRVRSKWRIDFISSVTWPRPCNDCWSDWPAFYDGLRYLNASSRLRCQARRPSVPMATLCR